MSRHESSFWDMLASALSGHEKRLNDLVDRLDRVSEVLGKLDQPASLRRIKPVTLENDYERNVFSVASNSTVSALTFDSENRKLSFTVSGSLDIEGYVNVYIAKSLVENIENVRAYLDGGKIDYTATSLDDQWLLHFSYPHSKHNITINLGNAPNEQLKPWESTLKNALDKKVTITLL